MRLDSFASRPRPRWTRPPSALHAPSGFASLLVSIVLIWGLVPAAKAQSSAPRPSGDGEPVAPGVWRLHGTDPSLPQDDLAPLVGLVGDATVVGLGEPVHTSGGFYRMKHRMIRELVERAGFRVITMETGWVGADKVESYLQKCSGPADAASHNLQGIWDSTEVRDLLTWACSWNKKHRKPADRIHFQGFDIQDDFGQIAVNAKALRSFLNRIGVRRDDPRSADLDRCDGVVTSVPFGEIPAEDYTPCSAALQAIDGLFTTQAATIARRTSKTDFAWARLHRLGMAAWEDASFNLHRPAPAYENARDQGMAATFLGLRQLRFPKSKFIVWAHNAHVAFDDLDPQAPPDIRWMGSHLRAALGSAYFTLAQGAKEVEVDWDPFCGRLPSFGADPSLENTLHQRGEGDLLLDLREPGVIPGGVVRLGDRQVIPAAQWNALVYLESSPRMHPLAWPPCQE